MSILRKWNKDMKKQRRKFMATDVEKKEKESKKASQLIIFGFLVMVLSILLPFASANEDYYKSYLERNADSWEVEEVGLTKGDAIDVSLVEYIRVYSYAASNGVGEEIAVTFLVLIGFVLLMGIVCVEGAIHKKSKGVIVANIIGSIVYVVMAMDFVSRGVIGGSKYKFGFGVYVYGVAVVVILLGAILMMRAEKMVINNEDGGDSKEVM